MTFFPRVQKKEFCTPYNWFHIVMGWILTSLLIVGLTGLVRT